MSFKTSGERRGHALRARGVRRDCSAASGAVAINSPREAAVSQKRSEVFIEIDELLMLDRAGRPLRGWCGACGAEVALLAPSWAALAVRRSERAVYQLA